MFSARIQHLSSAFLWRRIHSLMGLWLVIFLFEHLIVNSQAALWIGNDGSGFVKMVNLLESLPFLQVIEWLLIGVPLLVHGGWGIARALQPKLNSFGSREKTPHLPYARNRAFTWQRLTSWILIFGVIAHVVQMRFLHYPKKVEVNNELRYLTKVSFDEGLYTLAARLHVTLYSPEDIDALKDEKGVGSPRPVPEGGRTFSQSQAESFVEAQGVKQRQKWIRSLHSFHLAQDQVLVEAKSPGMAMLFMVRDQFKSPIMLILYTIFVLAAAFHACNGVWTALITWGVALSYRSQKAMIPVSVLGMLALAFLGLAAIWGSYWINLRS